MREESYRAGGISHEVFRRGEEALTALAVRFEEIDRIAETNQLKVLQAMQKNRVAADLLNGTTGYGYNDAGRDTLEKVYADTFHTEDALVRPQITCGTHALSIALAAGRTIPLRKSSGSGLPSVRLPSTGSPTRKSACFRTAASITKGSGMR